MSELYEFDKRYKRIVAGVDEAGRGPLAGPVVAAAAVIKKYDDRLESINDSKKLSEKKREELYNVIMECFDVGVGIVDVGTIDKVNILNATFKAMNSALTDLNEKYELVLVDGNKKIKEYNGEQEAVVKGDGKSLVIAAASIVAKVTRDRLMMEMAKNYPLYMFEKHKGYGTKLHIEKIREHGIVEEHRRSFVKKYWENNK